MKLIHISNNLTELFLSSSCGIDYFMLDLEAGDKLRRQKNRDTRISSHSLNDLGKISSRANNLKTKVMVRINSWTEKSAEEIEAVLENQVESILLPYFRTMREVESFIEAVNGRTKCNLLVESRNSLEILTEIVKYGGFERIHFGLNDLAIDFGMDNIFEIIYDDILLLHCRKLTENGIPFGVGGIGRSNPGMVIKPQKLLKEYLRLGSSAVILGRSFVNAFENQTLEDHASLLSEIAQLRSLISSLSKLDQEGLMDAHSEFRNEFEEKFRKSPYSNSKGRI